MSYGKWFSKALIATFSGGIDFTSDDFAWSLHDSGLAYDVDVQEFFTDLTNEISGDGYTAGGIPASSVSMVFDAITRTLRIDCDDPAWPAATLSGVRFAVLRKNTGTDATSRVVGIIDFEADQSVTGATGTVVIPFGGVIAVTIA